MKRVGVFLDVQNIYYTVREGLKGQFDYNYFWEKMIKDHCLPVSAIAYAIDRGDQKQIQFQNILRGIGFDVKLKPYISRSDGTSKGDWDVGMTIDMLELTDSIDHYILLSGDGDMSLLVDSLISKQKSVDVYGVETLTADSLKKSASTYIPINHSFLIKR